MTPTPFSARLSSRWLCRSQLSLCCILFGLIILGAGVRLADAGLACPDWPLCYGEAVPEFNFQIFMEWIHRVIAMSAGILALINSIIILSFYSTRVAAGKWVFLSLALFAAQAFLGKRTVTDLLRPEIVNAHLLGGYLLLAVQLLIWHQLRELCLDEKDTAFTTNSAPSSLKVIFGFFSLFALLQATLGGTVSSHYAGLVCPDFPTCQGEWIPKLEGLIAVKVFHRWGAFALLFATLFLTVAVAKSNRQKLKQSLAWIILLIVTQICVGISMVFTQLRNPFISLLHSAIAVSIFVLFWNGFLSLTSHLIQLKKRSAESLE